MLTWDSAPETEEQVRALGVCEFIVKGSSLHFLGDTLKRLLKTAAPATPTHQSLRPLAFVTQLVRGLWGHDLVRQILP